jgi:hypothetical protein
MGHDPAHGSVLEAVILVLVAGDASLASYIISASRVWRRSFRLFLSRGRRAGILGWQLCSQADRHPKREQKEKDWQPVTSERVGDVHKHFSLKLPGNRRTSPILLA